MPLASMSAVYAKTNPVPPYRCSGTRAKTPQLTRADAPDTVQKRKIIAYNLPKRAWEGGYIFVLTDTNPHSQAPAWECN
jgi:hypothetical protein